MLGFKPIMYKSSSGLHQCISLILPFEHKTQENFRQYFPGKKCIILGAIIANGELLCGLNTFKRFYNI
jgi:hypothetical protein